MSTSASTVVNAGDADGLWLTVSEIARQRGVDKAAVSRRLSRLESLGAVATRPGPRGTKLVNVAAYDRAVGETTDAIRAMNGGAVAAPVVAETGGLKQDPVLAREQARRTAYQAELAKLDLEERLGNLLPVDQIAAAVGVCAEGIVRAIEHLPARADELSAAVAKDGTQGARAVLKVATRDLRAAIERELRNIAIGAAAAHNAEAEAEAAE